MYFVHAPSHVLMVLLSSAFGALSCMCLPVFPLPPLPVGESQGLSLVFFFPLTSLFSVTVPDLGSGVAGGARGWVVGRAGLWGVPPTWVWVGGTSPQIFEHPTSICDTGVKLWLEL